MIKSQSEIQKVIVVVVHGGGPQIDNQLSKVGIKRNFIDGIRVTDEKTIEVVSNTLNDLVNKEIVGLINNNGGNSIGLAKNNSGLIKVKKYIRFYIRYQEILYNPRMSKKTKILLGVTGGIAAYKAAEITRLLIKKGYLVKVIMTRTAEDFITPLTFETLTNEEVYQYNTVIKDKPMLHIDLARWADLILIAPTTAEFLSKIMHGICQYQV